MPETFVCAYVFRCWYNGYRPLWFLLVQDVTYTRVDVVRLLIFNFQFSIVNFAKRLSGGYCGGVPPLPIPNREVKPVIADGTAMQCGRVGSRLLSFRRGFPNGKSLLFLSIFVPCFSSVFPLLYSLFLHSRNCSKSIKNIKSAIFLLDYFCKYLIFCNFAHEKVKNRIL